MRIAMAQIDTTVGAVRGNRGLIEQAFRTARDAGAELVITPELALAGYPPRDLLERADFVQACADELVELAACTEAGGALLVGTVERVQSGRPGKGIYNAAVLLAGGGIVARLRKSLLPTYDVFDEARYFQPAEPGDVRPISFGGLRLGVTICEDAWNDADFWGRQQYEFDPVRSLVDQGVDLLVNLSASPFHLGKQGLRRRMLGRIAQDSGVPVLQCNLVGGNDELVFDGASFGVWPDGHLRGVARSFEPDLVYVDLPGVAPEESKTGPSCEEEAAAKAITLGIRDYFGKCGFREAVIGLSGGIDSAVTAALAVRALGPAATTGITMPSRYSSGGSVEDSRQLAVNLGMGFHSVPIGPAVDAYNDMLGRLWTSAGGEAATTGITEQNIQARVRGNILMAWSNRHGALVLSTGNKSELAVGYCTLYGDMAGGLAVISDLPKTFVYRLARWLNQDGVIIPEATITKPPSAELAPDQLDTDSLPPYDVLDPILQAYLEEGRSASAIVEAGLADAATVRRIVGLVDRNEHKRRQAAPGIRVTSKAFGCGRRFPVAARRDYGSE